LLLLVPTPHQLQLKNRPTIAPQQNSISHFHNLGHIIALLFPNLCGIVPLHHDIKNGRKRFQAISSVEASVGTNYIVPFCRVYDGCFCCYTCAYGREEATFKCNSSLHSHVLFGCSLSCAWVPSLSQYCLVYGEGYAVVFHWVSYFWETIGSKLRAVLALRVVVNLVMPAFSFCCCNYVRSVCS
jgi:hypothetical protein